MAELQTVEGPINDGVVGTSSENIGLSLGSKRQRRPSVRLGEIGDQPATLAYESFVKRSKQWKLPIDNDRHSSLKETGAIGKSSRARPLTNLVNGGDYQETLETDDKTLSGDVHLDSLLIGNRKGKDLKAKKGGGVKKVRSNWGSKIDGVEGDQKFSGGEDEDEGFRDFDAEGSESPLKEQSPSHSLENTTGNLRQNSDRGPGNEREDLFPGHRRPFRARVSESRDPNAVELDGPSDNDARDWKWGMSADRNEISQRGWSRDLEDGVIMWLSGLGLGRYAPVFEIHEVDEEVLPLLTLEDLKDMGINAVGSRRKMFCAIQKLRKGFS